MFIIFLSGEELKNYIAKEVENPFRGGASETQLERLANLFAYPDNFPVLGDIPLDLRDALPNFLKKIVNDSNFEFTDESTKEAMAAIIDNILQYNIQNSIQGFQTFSAFAIAFPAVRCLESYFAN